MRNPFARAAKTETARPSLRERAAALKATAARVIRRKPVDAAIGAPAFAADPILAAIAETERLTDIRNAAAALPMPDGRLDPLPEQDAAQEAFWAHVDNVLLKTVPTTATGCTALARYAVEFLERDSFAIDEDESSNQHVRILDLIARSSMVEKAPADPCCGRAINAPATTADPVLDVLARYRAARDAWKAHDSRIAREGYGAFGGISEGLAAEDKLSLACSSLVVEALKTVPTTRAGCLALADFIEGWVAEHANTDDTPHDGSETVFGDAYPALLRAVRASAMKPAATGAPSPALVGMVAEWERLLDIENRGDLTDEQMSPICDARYRLHTEICAYPVASFADLAAKLPLFRGEIVASEPSNPLRPTMDYQSWCGIVRDVEALAGPTASLAAAGQQ